MNSIDLDLQINEVLSNFKGLCRGPLSSEYKILNGIIKLNHNINGHGNIRDKYRVEIKIPANFPEQLPIVKEIGNRITKGDRPNKDEHIEDNGVLCLGTYFRMIFAISDDVSLANFVKKCVIPFFYANSYYEQNKKYPWGDLRHAGIGLVSDYLEIFKLNTVKQLSYLVELLQMQKFKSRKMKCPCCHRRFRSCEPYSVVKKLESIVSNQSIRIQLKTIQENIISYEHEKLSG